MLRAIAFGLPDRAVIIRRREVVRVGRNADHELWRLLS
jgi:hypothetical protein